MTFTEQELAEETTGELQSIPHPGEILHEDFLIPMGITKNGLATAIGVPASRIGEIVRGTRSITADTDIRLSRYFGTSEGYWLRLQARHDLLQARRAGHYDGIKRRAA